MKWGGGSEMKWGGGSEMKWDGESEMKWGGGSGSGKTNFNSISLCYFSKKFHVAYTLDEIIGSLILGSDWSILPALYFWERRCILAPPI